MAGVCNPAYWDNQCGTAGERRRNGGQYPREFCVRRRTAGLLDSQLWSQPVRSGKYNSWRNHQVYRSSHAGRYHHLLCIQISRIARISRIRRPPSMTTFRTESPFGTCTEKVHDQSRAVGFNFDIVQSGKVAACAHRSTRRLSVAHWAGCVEGHGAAIMTPAS